MNSGLSDQVVRVVPMVASVQGVIVPSLGVETLRVAAGAGLRLGDARGFESPCCAGLSAPRLQSDGTTWLRQ